MYDAANQLRSEQTLASFTTFSFDANGNRLWARQDGAYTSFTWDFENRLTNVQYPNGTAETYTYAASGQRREKVTSAASTIYVWDGPNVLQETDVNLITQVRYTLWPGKLGGLVSEGFGNPTANSALFNAVQFNAAQFNGIGSLTGQVSSFYGYDRMGNVRSLTSATGAVTDTYLSKAFGDEVVNNGSTVNPYRSFGAWGYYRDAANRSKAGFREVDAANGVWLSRDPIGFWGRDWNLNRYVLNNPIAYVDPWGLYTASVGAEADLNIFFVHIGLSVQVALGYDPCKGWSFSPFLISAGAGPALGLGLSGSGFGQVTNASSVGQLLGPGMEGGGSVDFGQIYGLAAVSGSSPGSTYSGLKGSVGEGLDFIPGLDIPGEIHYDYTGTGGWYYQQGQGWGC